ncbi:MAG: D5-like helicase-primase [Terrestrivirus sp.]|uniref:D5-like helicase-primase n=1 Tax=Terrestrivirus sp. TaxID=2487775 RepID=A0A3G4ZPV6_9VIRU|nr:MAG: D5-like helicase-primase [Terrestrivirus sp.]
MPQNNRQVNLLNNIDIKNLLEFLEYHAVHGEGVEHTHTAYGPPYGKFNIKDENNDLDKFLILYKKALMAYKYAEVEPTLHIIERPKRVGPFVIDLDFRQNEKERRYTKAQVNNIVNKFNNKIKEYIKVSDKTNDVQAFVCEKDHATYDEKHNNYKDGFHIMYPHVVIDASLRYLILEEVRDEVKTEGILDKIGLKNTYEDIFDISVVYRNGWFMYGSKKDKGGQIYKLTQIYNGNGIETNIDLYDADELVVLLCLRQYFQDDCLSLNDKYNNDEFKAILNDEFDKFHGKKNKNNKNNKENDKPIDTETDKLRAEYKKQINNKVRQTSTKKEIEIAKKLTDILSENRATDYHKWLHVGWTLYNIDESLLEDYIKFSKKCPGKYHDGCCEKVWNNARTTDQDGFTIASLYWWAKEDDPKKYGEVLRESLSSYAIEAKKGSHNAMAKYVYATYNHIYKCASIKKNVWYEFQGNKWVQIDSAYTLANRLSDEVTSEFAILASSYLANVGNQKGQDRDESMATGTDILKIVDKLNNQGFKNTVIEACAQRFYDPKFEEKLDNNPFLVGFENGVFDLLNGCFREGTPDDFITMSTGYDYKEHDENDSTVREIEAFFCKLMTEEDMRTYVLTLLSSYFDGRCKDQNFILWTGSGCHKKGTKIMMHNGSIKNVEDIRITDKLMGNDSMPRTVHQLIKGFDDMYEIKNKLDDTSYTVNKDHRLALKYTGCNITSYSSRQKQYINVWNEFDDTYGIIPKKKVIKSNEFNNTIFEQMKEFSENNERNNSNFVQKGHILITTVSKFLQLPEEIRDLFTGFRCPVEFNKTQIYNDPYEAGENLQEYIPKEYIYNTRNIRLEYLAGIIDGQMGNTCTNTKGYYEIKLESEKITNDIIFLARSLGLNAKCCNNNIAQISGDLNMIPTRRSHQCKNCSSENNNYDLTYPIEIIYVEKDDYYGFELSDNGSYLLEDFTRTFNSNGKSTTLDLMRYTLGDYFGVLPTTVLTKKRGSSSSATPELADKRGKRLLVIQEPEHDDIIYVGQMKNLTGADWIEARALYGDPFMYKPQFKLLLACNELPQVPAHDGGTWRRLRVSPWESEFVDGPLQHNRQFPKDKELGEKMKNWGPAFSWILLSKYYPIYNKQGLFEPDKIKQFTDKYKKDTDTYYEYLRDIMVITKDPGDQESVANMYSNFKGWYFEGYSAKAPPRKDFANYIANAGYKVINGVVRGMRFRGPEDKVLDEDEE